MTGDISICRPRVSHASSLNCKIYLSTIAVVGDVSFRHLLHVEARELSPVGIEETLRQDTQVEKESYQFIFPEWPSLL